MGYYKSLKEREDLFKYMKGEIERSLARFTPKQTLESCTNLTMKELDALADAFCFQGEDITIRKFMAWLFGYGFSLNKLPGFKKRFWEKGKAAGVKMARAKKPQPKAWRGPESLRRIALKVFLSRGERIKTFPLGIGEDNKEKG